MSATVILVYGVCDESVYDGFLRMACAYAEDDGCLCVRATARDYLSVAKKVYSLHGVRPMYAEGRRGELYGFPKELYDSWQ